MLKRTLQDTQNCFCMHILEVLYSCYSVHHAIAVDYIFYIELFLNHIGITLTNTGTVTSARQAEKAKPKHF